MPAARAAFGAPTSIRISNDPKAARKRVCAGCGSATAMIGSSSICSECVGKIAAYNAMQEVVDDALIGTERVAVACPERIHLAHVCEEHASSIRTPLEGLLQAFPIYNGDLADVDHLHLVDAIPATVAGTKYVAAQAGAGHHRYRLVPGHIATHLANLDFAIGLIAASAYSMGLAEGEAAAKSGSGLPVGSAAL